jgi:hypothetical protein
MTAIDGVSRIASDKSELGSAFFNTSSLESPKLKLDERALACHRELRSPHLTSSPGALVRKFQTDCQAAYD